MKVSVRNLGVIKEAEIDLKPFTVFIGPNNAGKTWLAYALAGILGQYGWGQYTRAYIDGTINETYPRLEIAILKRILDSSEERKISVGKSQQNALLNFLKEPGKRELYIYTSTEGSISDKLPDRVIKDEVVSSVFHAMHYGLYEAVNTFATERTAFTAFPIFRQIGKQPSTFFVRHLTEPVSFLQAMIGEAFERSISRRQRDAGNFPVIVTYMQLAELIGKQILGGGVDFSTPEPDPRREILFEPDGGPEIELPIASSMVKELASLVLYLRYLAVPGELLIIDEPEMNLHPEAQAKMTEFLAMLVNAGLPVLITTHSPYIVDHLANLMKAAESTEPDTIQDKFYLKRKEAFISRNDVSVYLIDQGKAENMLDEDGVVHWSTFGTVSELDFIQIRQ